MGCEQTLDTVLATTFVSSTKLFARVPASLLAINTGNRASVHTDGGSTKATSPLLKSNSVSFQCALGLARDSPSISSISPTGAVAGSPDLTLTIMGSSFDGTGVIRSRAVWVANGSTIPLSTTFVSDTLLTAVIPSALFDRTCGSPSCGAAL